MKYFLLSVSKNKKLKQINIGDYVQALASSQYYPRIDGFLDRDEELNEYNGEKAKMIMNGWYMHNPFNWPPSSNIEPLFVAFHLNLLVKNELTSPESIAYLKSHEPIGCRDYTTMNILKEHGIDSYFSGCMTLTLGKTFKTNEKSENVYIVDPKVKVKTNNRNFIIALLYSMFHVSSTRKLWKKYFLFSQYGFKWRLIYVVNFYRQYTKVFEKKMLLDAIYVTQESSYYKYAFATDFDRLEEARRLITEYAKAALVITSRIHCALPCLGLGTPVLYTEIDNDSEVSQCRLKGLKDLFNVIECKNDKIVPLFDTKLPIDTHNRPNNKHKWLNLFESLDKRCVDFMRN